MPVGKTVAEHILDIVKLLQQDVADMKRRIGEEDMEPLDRRLKRLEAKFHAYADGTWKDPHDDGGMGKTL